MHAAARSKATSPTPPQPKAKARSSQAQQPSIQPGHSNQASRRERASKRARERERERERDARCTPAPPSPPASTRARRPCSIVTGGHVDPIKLGVLLNKPKPAGNSPSCLIFTSGLFNLHFRCSPSSSLVCVRTAPGGGERGARDASHGREAVQKFCGSRRLQPSPKCATDIPPSGRVGWRTGREAQRCRTPVCLQRRQATASFGRALPHGGQQAAAIFSIFPWLALRLRVSLIVREDGTFFIVFF